MTGATVDDLRRVIAVRDLPEEHLKWIYDRSEYVEFKDGEVIAKTGDVFDYLVLLFEGRYNVYMDVNGKLVYYFTFTNDENTGGAGGVLPYSRMKGSIGYVIASGKTRAFGLHKNYFRELEQLNPDFIQRLIGYMTERARKFATQKLQYEKVNALGQLAAGIAHELNNPAAAISQIAADLNRRLKQNNELTVKLIGTPAKINYLKLVLELVEQKKAAGKNVKLSALQRIQIEDDLNNWFESAGLAARNLKTDVFIDSGYTVDDLRKIETNVEKESLAELIRWFENLISTNRLVEDLDEASCRISNLVGAIKSHVQMDRGSERQPTSIHRDIDHTLTLLGYKLRDKNINVVKDYCSGLKDLPAYVGELNQVWSNIIDNAIYAMSNNGELTIRTQCSEKEVTAAITDNGTGIPGEMLSRIFDPFFTTKKMGEGTGLGLDLAMRNVKHHGGSVDVISKPGKTTFTVTIPLSPPV